MFNAVGASLFNAQAIALITVAPGVVTKGFACALLTPRRTNNRVTGVPYVLDRLPCGWAPSLSARTPHIWAGQKFRLPD